MKAIQIHVKSIPFQLQSHTNVKYYRKTAKNEQHFFSFFNCLNMFSIFFLNCFLILQKTEKKRRARSSSYKSGCAAFGGRPSCRNPKPHGTDEARKVQSKGRPARVPPASHASGMRRSSAMQDDDLIASSSVRSTPLFLKSYLFNLFGKQ